MEIMPGVHRIGNAVSTAYLLVSDREGLTLVDSGPAGFERAVTRYLARIGRRPDEVRRIILTHRHFDHVGGAARLRELTRARVLANPIDAPQITGAERNRLPKGVMGAVMSVVQPLAFPLTPCPVDDDLIHEQVIDLGDLGELRVVATPGHTLGHCSLLLPARWLLICGDALNNLSGTPRVSFDAVNDDTPLATRTVIDLAALAGEVDALAFGHGQPIVGAGDRALRDASEAAKRSLAHLNARGKGADTATTPTE